MKTLFVLLFLSLSFALFWVSGIGQSSGYSPPSQKGKEIKQVIHSGVFGVSPGTIKLYS